MIANNLKKLTEKRNLSIMDLARLTKIPKTTLYSIAERRSKCQTVYTLKQIADTLDCTLDELISDPNTQDGINAKILSLVKRAKKLNVQEQENIALILETAILTAERKTPSTK